MTSLLLSGFFAAVAILVVSSIAATISRYLRVALALREELNRCDDSRVLAVTVTERSIRPVRATALRRHTRFTSGCASSS